MHTKILDKLKRFQEKKLILIGIGLLVLISVGITGINIFIPKTNTITVLWTDRPEFVSYAELFNKTQSKHRLVVEYKENPAAALANTKTMPDLVAGAGLKAEKTRTKFIPIGYLFNELQINPNLFYKALLNLGNIQGHQYLLPISFNLPLVIFSIENQNLIKDDYTISLDEIKATAKAFNNEKNGVYSKMGFSPRWDSSFLYLITRLYNTNFEESGSTFTWKQQELDLALSFIKNWTIDSNTSTVSEDEFQFKYLYDPPFKWVTKGRSLFAYLSSEDLFLYAQDKLQDIDFRWITRNNLSPVSDDIIYVGLCKKSKNIEASEAFLAWFFTEKTQKELLERSKEMSILEHTFGIANGFSSLKAVNEKIFPLFYPALFGHLPQAELLAVPKILPSSWNIYKKNIIIPWLSETAAQTTTKNLQPSLENRITEWNKNHGALKNP